MLYDSPYFVVPTEKSAKTYALLREVLKDTERSALEKSSCATARTLSPSRLRRKDLWCTSFGTQRSQEDDRGAATRTSRDR
jgi:hypothetical protein